MKPNKVPYPIPMPNNMGMIRYILAFGVVISHFQVLSGYTFWFPLSSYSCVGGFFALSGFLIYGSYLKKGSAWKYLISRAIRIMPAYWMTVLFFAILLGAVSTLPMAQYFGSAGFWKYLVCNMLFANFAAPTLPGVFTGLPMEAVNGSLWTMKVEWFLYLTPPVVALMIRKFKMRPTVMFVLIYVLACGYRIAFLHLYELTGKEIYNILSRQFMGQLSYFYAGVICYYWYDALMRWRWWLLGASVVALVFIYDIPYGYIILHPLAVAVIVVLSSMMGKWGTWEGKRDNVSYNIYLIHFPVIQLVVSLGQGMGPVAALTASIAGTLLLACLFNILEIKIRRRCTARLNRA